MLRWTALIGLTAAVGCRARSDVTSKADAAPIGSTVDAASNGRAPALVGAARGKVLYDTYCALCHGSAGEGYVADKAPALANEELLATASDEYLRKTIADGRSGTTMSAWSIARGGPLVDADLELVIRHIRGWQKRPSEPTDAATIAGRPERARGIYAAQCATCHGAKGEEGTYTAIANPRFLAAASDGFLAAAIARGRPGTPMRSFVPPLSQENIADLVALLRSWQRPVPTKPELPPSPGALHDVVINPKGPPPAFDERADFVSIDAVKREIDRGASLVLVDARAPSDYVEMHVARAISVPFYDVHAYAAQLPKDRYIVTYCACPHAESVMARDDLRARGYPRVAVLDEGVNAWRDRGYPMRSGPKP